MKKMVTALCTLSVIVTACSKGNDSPNPTDAPASIIGKWMYVAYAYVKYKPNGTVLYRDSTPADVGEYIQFSNDGKVVTCSWTNQDGFTYQTDAYSVSNDTLFWHTQGSTFIDKFNIKELSESKFTYWIPQADTDPDGNLTDVYWYYKK